MNIQEQYSSYQDKKQRIVGLLQQSSDVISQLSMQQFQENLEKLHAKVDSDIFRVLVLGTFKNGKSTFINALLGEEVLPAYSIPCTAVINEVKYGTEKRALLHFRNPLPQELPKELAPRAVEHMQKYGMQNVPPMEIPYEELEDYVVIPMGKEAKDMLLESPYQKVELFWPLELLKNGVEIIDSPGLNENPERTKVTMEYLSQADAIIMLLIADKACAENEMSFVEVDLHGNGYEDIFFPVNRFDLIQRREKDMVKRFVETKVKPYTALGHDGIFFLSALNALDGKIDGDQALYEASGMPEFEQALSRYLTQNKGKAKLAQPARELKRILNEEALYKIIPTQRRLLSTSLEEQRKNYDAIRPKLDELHQRKDLLRAKLETKIERSRREFRSCISRYQADLADYVAEWIHEYQPKANPGLLPTKKSVEPLAQELQNHVAEMMKKSQQDWRNQVLLPMAEEKIQEIFETAEADAARIISDIDAIVNQSQAQNKNVEIESAPLWQRVVGAAGGLLIGNISMAISGGLGGFTKEMAKSFVFEAGAATLLLSLGMLTPVTALAIIAAGALMGFKGSRDQTVKKIKDSIIQSTLASISENKDQVINDILEHMTHSFQEVADQITNGLDAEIKAVDAQLQFAMAEMEKGKENVAAREESLNQCEKQIQRLNSALDEVIFQLMG